MSCMSVWLESANPLSCLQTEQREDFKALGYGCTWSISSEQVRGALFLWVFSFFVFELIFFNSDENWWTGMTLCGSGLFPASFVTRDLTVSPEPGRLQKLTTLCLWYPNSLKGNCNYCMPWFCNYVNLMRHTITIPGICREVHPWLQHLIFVLMPYSFSWCHFKCVHGVWCVSVLPSSLHVCVGFFAFFALRYFWSLTFHSIASVRAHTIGQVHYFSRYYHILVFTHVGCIWWVLMQRFHLRIKLLVHLAHLHQSASPNQKFGRWVVACYPWTCVHLVDLRVKIWLPCC